MSENIVVPLAKIVEMLGGLCPACMDELRRRLDEASVNLVRTNDTRLQKVLDDVSRETGVHVLDIVSRRIAPSIVDARRLVARRAKGMGYSFPEIGRLLDRHHATIINLIYYPGRKTVKEAS